MRSGGTRSRRMKNGWMRVAVLAALSASVAVVSFGCASSRYKTHAHVDTEYDFSKVDSYALQPIRAKAAESAGGKQLADALRDSLKSRGYEEVAAEQADVLISYDLGRYAPAKLSGANSFAITEGTLTVRVIDPPTGRTVWYGWVETRMRTDDDDSVIGEAVEALFEDQIVAARSDAGDSQ